LAAPLALCRCSTKPFKTSLKRPSPPCIESLWSDTIPEATGSIN
jgi:hypothetical protein